MPGISTKLQPIAPAGPSSSAVRALRGSITVNGRACRGLRDHVAAVSFGAEAYSRGGHADDGRRVRAVPAGLVNR
jgi:hypothetical protein